MSHPPSKLKLTQNVQCWDFPHHWELVHIRTFMQPMDVVVDVGAHVGTWCLNLAPYAKQVFAFEPDAEIFAALSENIKLNKFENIKALQVALSNHTGGEMLTVMGSGHSHIFAEHPLKDFDGNATAEYVKGKVPVVVDTLDNFLKDSKAIVDLIKVDTEGNEIRVLEGAHDTITRCNPVLYIEYHGAENRAKLKQEFGWLNFKDTGENGVIGALIHRRE